MSEANIKQFFKNNFNDMENNRFDIAMAHIFSLYPKKTWPEIEKRIKNQLLEVLVKQDSNNSTKGCVYGHNEEYNKYNMYYIEHSDEKLLYTWHVIIHELMHFVGKLSDEQLEEEYNFDIVNMSQILVYDNGDEYSKGINEIGTDILTIMSMTMNSEFLKMKPEVKNMDNVLNEDVSFFKTDYNYLKSIVRLLAIASDNSFEKKTYYEYACSDDGLLGAKVLLGDEEFYVNDFFYAMTGNGRHMISTFDKNTYDGCYKEISKMFDSQFRDNFGQNCNKNVIKNIMLKIADMFNCKMYRMYAEKYINEAEKEFAINRFNVVFNQCLKQYNIAGLTSEDIDKTTISTYKYINDVNTSEFKK